MRELYLKPTITTLVATWLLEKSGEIGSCVGEVVEVETTSGVSVDGDRSESFEILLLRLCETYGISEEIVGEFLWSGSVGDV